MKLWDDSLRICPKCNAKVRFDEEAKRTCPQCRSSVWFYNYRKLKAPPSIPPRPESDVWSNRTARTLLFATSIFGLVALFGFFNSGLVAVVSSLAAIGFSAVAFLKHAEARNAEQRLEHAIQLEKYSQLMQSRIREVVIRYNNLLFTGDERINEYFERIYLAARNDRQAAKTDREAIRSVQGRIDAMAERFLDDHRKWVARKLRADPESYQRHKNTLNKAFEFVETVGYEVPMGLRDETIANLKANYKQKVYEQTLKDEQKRIKAQMREEKRLRKEREDQVRESERREKDIHTRLEEALNEQAGTHADEIAELRRQLADAQSQSERAKSMAQQTKVGHVYILSNIGTLGDGIFKVGMTRRIDPALRVKELGDASVPFPFDVHAMFSCDDAPALENTLHRELTRFRVNRINLRKEFFNVDLRAIMEVVRHHHGRVEYVAEPEALEYRESLTISPEVLINLESDFAEMGVDVSIDDDEETVTNNS